MKVKYMAALAASAVFGMTALTSCGEPATEVEGDTTTEVEVDPCAAEADPCAAEVDPCAAPDEADPCAAE